MRSFKWPSIYRVVSFDVPLKPSYLHRFWSKKCFSHFCRETTNKNDQFSKWKTWIFNSILDQTKLWRVLLWIRIEIMSAVTLNLSIDSILIKLLCRLVNFEEMKKEIYKMIFKKRWWKALKILPPKSRILGFFSTNCFNIFSFEILSSMQCIM